MTISLDRETRRRIGWMLLTIAFLLGCLTIGWYEFGDEADSLVVGLLLTRHYVLYRDVFSHHFPFPYYWSAAAISLFGKSILAARFSVWVYQIAAFGIAMRLTRFHMSLGLAALIWSLLRHLYRANMLLYSPFSGASLVVAFAVTLAIILEDTDADWRHSLAIGIFSAVAVLSDPLTVYAIAVTLIAVFVKKPKLGLQVLAFAALGLSGYLTYLLLSGTLQAFLRDAIVFNSEVYATYLGADHLRFRELLDMVWKGLELLDPAWRDPDPLRPISMQHMQVDSWAFTGLLYRLAVILGAVTFLWQKRYGASAFLYLFAAAALSINRWGFRATGFVMVSLVALGAVLSQEWQRKEKRRTFTVFQRMISVGLSLIMLWLCIRVVHYTFVQNRDMLRADFMRYETESSQIRELACEQVQNVQLGHYPGGTYYYWFTEMDPVSKYVFLWPWVAEIGLPEIINELDREQALALVYVEDFELWGLYDTREYLAPLYEYLDEHYVKLDNGAYMSPRLSAQCQE